MRSGRGIYIVWRVVLLAAVLQAGCGRPSKAVRKYQVNKPPPEAAHPPADATHPPAGARDAAYTWELPEGWSEDASRGSSSMRLASFLVRVGGAEGTCSIVELAGEGGGLAANVNRWRGQIGLPTASEEEIAQAMEAFEGFMGEIRSCELVNPNQPGAAFIAAILPRDSVTVFVKLGAKAEALPALRDSFKAFSVSIRPRPPSE